MLAEVRTHNDNFEEFAEGIVTGPPSEPLRRNFREMHGDSAR